MKLRFDLRFFPALQAIDRSENKELRERNEMRLRRLKRNGTLVESDKPKLIQSGLFVQQWGRANRKMIESEKPGEWSLDKNGTLRIRE